MYFLMVYPGALHKESKYIGCRNPVAVQHNLKWARTSDGAVHFLRMVCSEENWPDESITLGLIDSMCYPSLPPASVPPLTLPHLLLAKKETVKRF